MKVDEAFGLCISVINKFVLFWKFGRSRSHDTVEVANSNVYSSSSSRDRYRNRDRREGRTFRAAWVANGRFEANVAVPRARERERGIFMVYGHIYLPIWMRMPVVRLPTCLIKSRSGLVLTIRAMARLEIHYYSLSLLASFLSPFSSSDDKNKK